MAEVAANYGNWLANESAKVVGNVDTASIFVAGARSIEEVYDLVVPLSRKLKNGVTVWAKKLTEKAPESSGKVKFKHLNDGEWDLFIFSPYMVETSSVKSIQNDLAYGLTMIKRSGISKVLVCAPKFPDANPIAIRAKLFGSNVPATEEIKGALCEEDMYTVLEGFGFAQLAVGRLQCRLNLTSYFKGYAEGNNQVAAWFRVSPEACKKLDPAQLRKLCEKGTECIQQTKSIFLVPLPLGFERDTRAQPSPRRWWPNGDFSVFNHYGLQQWTDIRKNWTAPVPEAQRNKIEKVPKMSSRELNELVDTLTTNHDRIELPGRMRLDDLLDVLVDVWDSMDDA